MKDYYHFVKNLKRQNLIQKETTTKKKFPMLPLIPLSPDLS